MTGHSRSPRNGRIGNGDPVGRRARHPSVDRLQGLLQLDLRALELGSQLRREVAPPIDLVDELRPCQRGARGGSPGRLRGVAERGHFGTLLPERLVGGAELGEVLFVQLGAPPVDGGDGRDHPVGAAEFLHVRHVQEQADVAGPAQLVELDHPGLEHRPGGCRFGLEGVDLVGGVAELVCDALRIGLDVLELFGLEIALDFELPQVDEQRALLGRERVGFALQLAEALVRAPRLRFGARPLAGLGGYADGEEDEEQQSTVDSRQS